MGNIRREGLRAKNLMRWWQQGPDENGLPTARDTRNPGAQFAPITNSQYDATFDKDFRLANPYLAGRDALGSAEIEERDGTDEMGFNIGKRLNKGWASLHRNDWSSLGTNATIGAGLGVGTVSLINTLRDRSGSEPIGWKGRVLAGLLGAGAGGLLTAHMRGFDNSKAAAAFTGFGAAMRPSPVTQQSDMLLRETILRKVIADRDLDLRDRAGISQALAALGGEELRTLFRITAVGAGAGAGAVVARWLMGRGLLPTLIGGIVGGGAAYRATQPRLNAFGNPSLESYR